MLTQWFAKEEDDQEAPVEYAVVRLNGLVANNERVVRAGVGPRDRQRGRGRRRGLGRAAFTPIEKIVNFQPQIVLEVDKFEHELQSIWIHGLSTKSTKCCLFENQNDC